MTPTQDTAGHPDVTEISDLVEGVLAPDRAASVRGHLGDCVLCADVQAALEEIRCSLGTLPGPVRMPADIAGRIDAALAAEALLSASGTSAPGSSGMAASPGTGHRSDVSRETSRLRAQEPPRHSQSTAGRPVGSPGPRPTAPEAGPGRTDRSGRARRLSWALAAVLASATVGLGLLLTQAAQEDPPVPTAAVFSGRPLGEQVTGLLAETRQTAETGSPGPRTLMRPTVDVPACVREGIESGQDPLAAQKGSFRGEDAYLVLLPDPESEARVTAYVVEASCIGPSSAGNGTTGEVLLTRTYARPSS